MLCNNMLRVTLAAPRKHTFPLLVASSQEMRPTESRNEREPVAFSLAVKRKGREDDRSFISSAEMKYAYSYTSTADMFMARCLIKEQQGSRHNDLLLAGRYGDRILVEARFSLPVQTGPDDHPVSCTKDARSHSRGLSSRGVVLTTEPHPAPMFRTGCTSSSYPLCMHRHVIGYLYIMHFLTSGCYAYRRAAVTVLP